METGIVSAMARPCAAWISKGRALSSTGIAPRSHAKAKSRAEKQRQSSEQSGNGTAVRSGAKAGSGTAMAGWRGAKLSMAKAE